MTAVIFVIDSADTERLPEAKKEFASIVSMVQENCEAKMNQLAFLIMANKQDLAEAKPVYELCAMLDLHTLLQGMCWKIMPTSATTGEGVSEGM